MLIISVTMGRPVLSLAFLRSSRPSALRPWNAYGEVRGLNAPPRRNVAPAALTRSATQQICASLSTEHGPAMSAKGTVADHLTGRKLDDRIFRMELTVCFFIRLLHALDAFYNILCGDVLAVYRSGIADKAEHGGMCADPCVNTDVITVGEIRNEVFDLFFTAVGFEYDDHVFFPYLSFIGAVPRCRSRHKKAKPIGSAWFYTAQNTSNSSAQKFSARFQALPGIFTYDEKHTV